MPNRNFTLLASFCLLIAQPQLAAAQPYAWVVDNPLIGGRSLLLVNLASTERRLLMAIPPSVFTGDGAMSNDGRYYLVPTSVGIARFRTDTRTLDVVFGPAVVGRLTVSATRIHLAGNGRHYVVDPVSGSVLSERAVRTNFRVAIAPSGLVRYEFDDADVPGRTTISAVDDSTDQVLWTNTIVGSRVLRDVVTAADLAFGVVSDGIEQLAVLSSTSGAERARFDLPVHGLACCSENSLLVSSPAFSVGTSHNQLFAIDLTTFERRLVDESDSFALFAGRSDVMLSSDGTVAYWLNFSALKASLASTSYRAIQLATGEVTATGYLGAILHEVDIEPAAPCRFDFPTPAPLGPAGGTAEIPVTPVGTCDPWTASAFGRVANPGPHAAAATLRVPVPATPYAVPSATVITLLGRTISIVQSGAPPAAPELTGEIRDGRAHLAWSVAIGAATTEFVIRGGVRGGEPTSLAVLAPQARSWVSGPLPPGSFAVDVVAHNYAGAGPPSNRVEFSHAVAVRPDPPIQLSVQAADDVVSLKWLPAPSGPAPAEYLVEAATNASGIFVPVLRLAAPRADVFSVPAGNWLVRVRAVTDGGASDPSASVSFTTAACTSAPSALTALHMMSNSGHVTLRWSPPASGGAVTYVIEARDPRTSAGAVQLEVSGSMQAFDAPVPSGSLYAARVRARNACGDGAPSNEVFAYVP